MPENKALANPDRAHARLVIGCGYLGGRVAAAWLRRGLRVFATTRGRPDELRQQGIAPIAADVTVPEQLHSLPHCAAVVYCVGFDRRSGHPMRKVYVQG